MYVYPAVVIAVGTVLFDYRCLVSVEEILKLL